MKVDKDNLWHWILLVISAGLIFASMPFRIFKKKNSRRVVFFYQMHGNSRALVDYIAEHDKSIEMYFLAFPEYLKIYEGKQDLPALNMLSFRDMIKVAQCDVLITNYGALTLIYYAKFTSIKFVDTFHGILLLKFMPAPILTYLNYYKEVWVSSPYLQKIYREKSDVIAKTVPTGYARVDKLVNGSYENVKQKYGLPTDKKIIMIAPTWKHNDPNRNLLPFGMDESQLTAYFDRLAQETNSYVIFRAHMLSGNPVDAGEVKHVRAMPSNDYPDTEELLSAVDILITDWSSLAFDFMVLDRPVFFIDTKPPFKGEDIVRRSNPAGRFGEIVKDKDEFDTLVRTYLQEPELYLKKHQKSIERLKEEAYGGTADGRATERYYERLQKLLQTK
jgi:CDP-glycerol glycerophosphotransferase